MASSSFAWLSVVVKQGLTTLVPRKVVKADWEDNFGQLLTIVEPGFEGKVVDKILISPMNALRTAHQVQITAPLSVCDTFRYCVHYYVTGQRLISFLFFLNRPTGSLLH